MRAAVVGLSLCACWHDPPAERPYPPLPVPKAGKSWVVEMGPTTLDTSTRRQLSSWPATTFVQSMPRSGGRVVAPTAVPALSPLGLCGMEVVAGGHEVGWCIDAIGRGLVLFVDDNADGDLTNDTPRRLVRADRNTYSLQVESRFLVEVTRGPSALFVQWTTATERAATFHFHDRDLFVRIAGTAGRFDVHPVIQLAGAYMRDGHAEIDGVTLAASVARDGSRVTFTEVPP